MSNFTIQIDPTVHDFWGWYVVAALFLAVGIIATLSQIPRLKRLSEAAGPALFLALVAAAAVGIIWFAVMPPLVRDAGIVEALNERGYMHAAPVGSDSSEFDQQWVLTTGDSEAAVFLVVEKPNNEYAFFQITE